MDYYFNHSRLENSDQMKVEEYLKEISQISFTISNYGHIFRIAEDFWSIPIKGGALGEYLHRKANKDLVQTTILSIMNSGPWYNPATFNANLIVSPSIANVGFALILLHTCFRDKQEYLVSMINEKQLINNSYNLNDGVGSHSVINVIGTAEVENHLKQTVTFNSVDDVFFRVKQKLSKVVVLDDAIRSSRKHNFIGILEKLYYSIEALETIELPLVIENTDESTRIKVFKEYTKLEISKESSKTLSIPKHLRQREFIIPSLGACPSNP